MAYKALLWDNDACTENHMYTFSRKCDLTEMMNLSVDWSLCYLERNVFAHRYPGGIHYGHMTDNYMQKQHTTKALEKFLHKRVEHWKDCMYSVIE